jgi:hypothetical protein
MRIADIIAIARHGAAPKARIDRGVDKQGAEFGSASVSPLPGLRPSLRLPERGLARR